MASTGPENKGPSVAELQRFVRAKTLVQFWLVNGKTFEGTLRWFDENCYSVVQADGSAITLTKSGVAGYKALKPVSSKPAVKK